MTAQSPPFALQNSSQHSAQLFRQAVFSGWRQGGIVGPADLQVAAQSTPNMSVQVSAGRAWMTGTQIASVSGGDWSTQAGYFGINDAPLSVSISTADATNPRIDLICAYVQDQFYSGANNQMLIGAVTGTPAPSPSAPSAPSNAIVLAQVAVAANATSIVSGNITNTAGLLTVARGGILPVTSTDATNGQYVDQYRGHPTNGLERWDGSQWTTANPFAWTDLLRSTSYSSSVPVGSSYADITSGAFTVNSLPRGRELDVEWKAPEIATPASSGLFLHLTLAGTVVDSGVWSTGTAPVFFPGRLNGSITIPSSGSVAIHVQGYAQSNPVPIQAGTAGGAVVLRYRVR